MSIRLLLALAVVCLTVTAALADDERLVGPADLVAGDTTYADLIREIFPDFSVKNGAGSRVLNTRFLDGGGAMQETLTHFDVNSVPVVSFDDGGKPRLLMLLDLSDAAIDDVGFAIAALFDGDPPYALMDMANVGLDRMNGFAEDGHLVSKSGRDVFVVQSEHFNGNQTYDFYMLMTADGGKLAAIDTVSTLGERFCTGETKQTARFVFGDGPAGAEPLLATVEIESIPSGADCGDTPTLEAKKRTISVTYRPAKGTGAYTADSDAFKRLDHENEQRR